MENLPVSGSATQLDRIISRTLLSVRARKTSADFAGLERLAALHTPRGFARNLRYVAFSRPAVIAELKKASPSKGVLRADYVAAPIATQYEEAGAAAISVLTDEEFFQGSLDDLVQVSKAVNIPVLRKDFMLDPFQILEARAAGADAILLIVAAHTDADLRALNLAAQLMQMDVLCEVHNEEELTRAIDLGCETIGVNCRNLKTLEVHLDLHEALANNMPSNVIRVAESGIRTHADIERLTGAGYSAFLVGEALMREADPGAALSQLTGRAYAHARP